MSFLGHLFFCLLCNFLLSVSSNSNSGHLQNTYSSSTKHSCHGDERSALLQFKNSFHIDENSFFCDSFRSISWTNESDCCEWDEVRCSPVTGHVIGLDLSCAALSGKIYSNSSLFLLGHLRSLNLAFNNLYHTVMSPKFGQFFHLQYLNLSNTQLFGNVPAELSYLEKLTSLDLSGNDGLIMPTFKTITNSLVGLKELDLSEVSIPSFPESLTNLSSLESLRLSSCDLSGKFPSDILAFPSLRVLDLSKNHRLYSGNVVDLSDWSSPIEIFDLSSTNFSRQLPHSVGPGLSNSLRILNLFNCSIYGPIPKWVWNATESINLSMNHFTGELPLSLNIRHLSGLSLVDLSQNLLNGTIPSWLFCLPSISELPLDSNQFTSIDKTHNASGSNLDSLYFSSNFIGGTIELSMFSNLKNLYLIDFSNNNNIMIGSNEINFTSSFPNLETLFLSSCNISEFPFLPLPLSELNLSNNAIRGEIPKWLSGTQLQLLDLSHNQISIGLENLPWESLEFIDISYNMLQGQLPVHLSNLRALIASSNRISGGIHLSICKATSLVFLDLSNNTLEGEIPNCLGNSSSYLTVLNLSSNNLSGSTPLIFSNCDAFVNLDLSYNRLEGIVPRSLAQCSNLEVLNLGNNKFIDTFPYWLGKLSRSNYFHGHVTVRSYSRKMFSKLRILDLSENRFNGTLSSMFILNMQAMRYMSSSEDKSEKYMGGDSLRNGYFSFVMTIKGIDHRLERILNTLTAFDVSSNLFEGEIPSSIGKLYALRGLNFSHNKFSKEIPRSLGSLKLLESLDLSCNNLSGKVPEELGSLTFLEVFNVSQNQLVGPIPGTTQLSSLDNSSYLGNSGLCGLPLSKKCSDEETTHQQGWLTILILLQIGCQRCACGK